MDALTNSMPPLGGKPVTMSSREIAELTAKQHQHVKRDIEKMLVELGEDVSKFGRIYLDSMNREQTEFRLDRDLTETLLLGYSAPLRLKVIRRLREIEAALTAHRPMTAAEMFLQNAQILVDLQNQQAKHQAQLAAIGDRVEKVAQAQTVMSAVPANAESIVHLRKRIWKMFGLSDSTVDAVLRQSPYAPKPAGVVRNNHVDAENSTFTVWWKKDVTALFHRFTDESTQVSGQFFTHPFFEGRFKMMPPAEAGMIASKRKS